MKRIVFYISLLLLALGGVLLARLNADSAVFNFYFFTVELPLAALLYTAVAFGALAGVLLSMVVALRARAQARQLRKRLKVCEQEIKNLREIPIKGKF